MSEVTLVQALSRRRTVRDFSAASIPIETLKKLLWAAQGITAKDGKRTAPSAHAMHPLKLFVLANCVTSIEKGLYVVDQADLALSAVSTSDLRVALRQAAIGAPEWITDAACVIAICADLVAPSRAFAEQKPYGMRGARYVYLEAGAAAQNLQLQAAAEGLGCVLVGGFDDEAAVDVLELEPPFMPIVFVCVGYAAQSAE